jgi:hypothetical protein
MEKYDSFLFYQLRSRRSLSVEIILIYFNQVLSTSQSQRHPLTASRKKFCIPGYSAACFTSPRAQRCPSQLCRHRLLGLPTCGSGKVPSQTEPKPTTSTSDCQWLKNHRRLCPKEKWQAVWSHVSDIFSSYGLLFSLHKIRQLSHLRYVSLWQTWSLSLEDCG